MMTSVQFKTYGETTKINLTSKTMPGLKGDAPFVDYFELFKAASLTNYIKSVCKSKSTDKGLPYKMSTGDIAFDGTDGDVDLISAVPLLGKLDNVSETLYDNKKDYVAYLNTTRDPTGNSEKIKILAGNNQETELKILNSINLFYEQMPSDKKEFIRIG